MRFSIALLLVCAAGTAHAQVNPAAHWHQISSNHFRVVYETGLDSVAQHAIARAELEHARLSAGLVKAPRHKIDIIIGDNTDITNGFATPFPDNRIYLYARPPVDELSLQYYRDWMDLVVTHELTHIFHLEQSGKVGRALRGIFGRVPVTWPFFPIADMPRWNLEGLATLIESQHTGAGRLEGSYHEMVLRTDVLEHHFAPIDRVSGETPIWPGGNRAYIYGSLFMDYIARRYGAAAHTALIRQTAGSWLPGSWRMDAIARKAIGKSYSDLYREWHGELEQNYGRLADSLRARGITPAEQLTTTGRYAWFARVSPDSRRVAYADENGRDVTATRILDVVRHDSERIRRNGFGPIAWLPDASGYITAQYELVSPYQVYSDLYVVKGGEEERLTYGERDETPDVSRDGNSLVYVQNVPGTNRLMLRDMRTGAARVLVPASADAQWTLPRWSPDGRRIAVQRWTRAHGHDIAIVDPNGRIESEIRTEGTDAAPAWSPDGRYVVFSSDRTGITNLYASDGTSVQQVSNVLSGAFYPDVSPDGRWIYYSAYHTDGFHIERMPYDPASWRPLQPAASPAAMRPDTMHAPNAAYENTRVTTPGTYHGLRSALPRFWIPVAYGDTALGTFIGLTTLGTDDVNRHNYFITAAYDFKHQRVAGDLNYSYAGLGNPLLNLDAARDWDYTGHVRTRNSAGDTVVFKSFKREDRVTLSATVLHPRWRRAASMVVGLEGVELHRGLVAAGTVHFRDPEDRLLGLVGGFGFGNARSPALAISREDGVRVSTFVRRRIDLNAGVNPNASYTEYSGVGAAYKSIDALGFAHHALAARASGLVRTGTGVGPTDVGGTTGLLPIRGYESDARIGFRAWTTSLEYRLPLALVGRGYHLRPLFLDRMSLSGFFDAGNASCTSAQRELYLSCAGGNNRPGGTLLSAGAELNASVAVFTFFPVWLRAGLAQRLSGGKGTQFYITLGPSF